MLNPLLDRRVLASFGNLADLRRHWLQIDVGTDCQQRFLVEDRHTLEPPLEERSARLFFAADSQSISYGRADPPRARTHGARTASQSGTSGSLMDRPDGLTQSSWLDLLIQLPQPNKSTMARQVCIGCPFSFFQEGKTPPLGIEKDNPGSVQALSQRPHAGRSLRLAVPFSVHQALHGKFRLATAAWQAEATPTRRLPRRRVAGASSIVVVGQTDQATHERSKSYCCRASSARSWWCASRALSGAWVRTSGMLPWSSSPVAVPVPKN